MMEARVMIARRGCDAWAKANNAGTAAGRRMQRSNTACIRGWGAYTRQIFLLTRYFWAKICMEGSITPPLRRGEEGRGGGGTNATMKSYAAACCRWHPQKAERNRKTHVIECNKKAKRRTMNT